MARLKNIKLRDLKFDANNINAGTEFGTSLLSKSLTETGMGRSVLADKNGVLIAGNKTVEMAGQLGIEKVVEVETDGTELIVVKRKDLDINEPKGMKAKILDNTVNKHNYREDAEMVSLVVEQAEISNLKEYGLSSPHKEEGDDVHFKASTNVIKITLAHGQDMDFALMDITDLMERKYPGAIIASKGKS